MLDSSRMGFPLTIFSAVVVALIAFAGIRLRRCQHRFGVPIYGHVRCMKCAQQFPIEATGSGEWRIARRPIEERPAS